MRDPITIKCGECGHQNEPERVYCHNCGAKLDRSILPEPKQEDPEKTRKQMNRMFNPGANPLAGMAKTLVSVLIYAAIIAALLLFWLPPEAAPEIKKDDLGDTSLRTQWETQMSTPTPGTQIYTEAAANSYLLTLKSAGGTVDYKGSIVQFEPGVITLYVKREIFGAPLWSKATCSPVTKDGKVSLEIKSLHFGRLGVPPSATFAHGWGIGPVLETLKKSFGNWERVSGVDVSKDIVTVTTR